MLKTTESQASKGTVLRPGQIVGAKYRVGRLLAEGGMAAVWGGTNTRTGKQVALKVILPIFAAVSQAMELFRREALAASRVNHPNVVNIFDVIDHDGMTCIVMELLDGESLAAYLAARGPLPIEEAVELLLPAMRGVAAANARGIIHRDLKPGNLFLCRDPEGRLLTTKVLDFGISMSAERSVDCASVDSALGPSDPLVRFGTPAYMAPEDIEYPQVVDSRTDVYGFGVLLFETLTGKVPFPGEPSQALLTQILIEPAPRIAAFRTDVPSRVQLILDHALAKNPSDRFPDVGHFIRAIEDHLMPELLGRRSFSRTLALGSSAVDESQGGPLVTVTSSGEGSGLTRMPRKAWKFGFGALLERRTVGAALLVGTLLVSPWLAFRDRGIHNTDASQPPHSSPAPFVTVLPAPSIGPPALIAGTGYDPRAADVGNVPVGAMVQRVPSRRHPDAKSNAYVAGRPPVRSPRTARAESEHRRAQPSVRSNSSRAGTLSASDF